MANEITHETLDPIQTIAKAYKQAGDALMQICFEAIGTGQDDNVVAAKDASKSLVQMNVPYSDWLNEDISYLTVHYKNIKRYGYTQYDAGEIERRRQEAAHVLLWAYGLSGFEVSNQQVNSVAYIGRSSNSLARYAMTSHAKSGNSQLHARWQKDDGTLAEQYKEIGESELLRMKINGREAAIRHGGVKWLHNFHIAMYQRRLVRLEKA